MTQKNKFFILLFIILCFNANLVTAQCSFKGDSLNAVLKAGNEDSARANKLLQISSFFFERTNADSCFLFYAQKALRLSAKINYDYGKAKANYMIANYYTKSGQLERGLDFYYLSLSMFQKLNSKSNISRTHYNIGGCLAYLGKYDKAKQHLLDGVAIQLEQKDTIMLIKSYNAIANVLNEQNKTILAIDEYKKALALTSSKNILSPFYINAGLAKAYLKVGNLKEAKRCARIAMEGFIKHDKPMALSAAYEVYGQIYEGEGNIDASIKSYEKALGISKKLNNLDLVKNNYNNLYQLHNKKKDIAGALNYYMLYVKTKDSILSLQVQKNIDEMVIKYEGVRKDLKIQLLNKDAERKEIEITLSKQKQKNTVVLSVILFSLLTIIGIVVLAYTKKRQKVKLELIEKEKIKSELNVLKNQINPHVMFNSLNAIYFEINYDINSAKEMMLKFTDLLRYQLYECNLEEIEIYKELDYLKKFVEIQEVRKSKRCKIEFKISENVRHFKLPPLLLIPLFENAFKYVTNDKNESNFVTIEMDKVDDCFTTSLQNTYYKKEFKSTYSGIGLSNLKSRLDLLYRNKHELEIQETDRVFTAKLKLYV